MASAAELQADLSALAGRLEEGTTTALDPQEEGDRRLIESFLDLANKRSDRYPALHKALNRADCVAKADPEELRIVDAGRTKGGQATACAWHAPRGGAYLSGATTVVLDSESHEVLAVGSGTQVGGALSAAPTDTAVAAEAGNRVSAISFSHSQGSAEEAPHFSATLAVRKIFELASHPVVKEPEPRAEPLVIGVGRPNDSKYCVGTNYCYSTQAHEEETKPLLVLPFSGEALDIPSPITGVGPNGEISGLAISTALYAQIHGQPILSLTEETRIRDGIKAMPGNTGVSWTFPIGKVSPDPVAATQSLKYGPTSNYNTSILWFYFDFAVPVEDPSVSPYHFCVCSKNWESPSETCSVIPELRFWWHCLGAGTQVTLEDGSTKPIEEVTNLLRVKTGLGGSLGVEATTRGIHRDGDYPGEKVLRLVTQGGRELILSPLHPVMTPAGLLAAKDLHPGTEVLTEDGVDAVGSCQEAPYEGLLLNLVLVDESDRVQGMSAAFGTFLANGIVVGDYESQAAHYEATRHDLDYMKARLPEENHTDFESALVDIAAAS